MPKKDKMKDDTKDQDKYIYDFLEKHIEYCQSLKTINSKLNGIKKIRQPNFPETISEYIAKNFYGEKYKKNIKFGPSGDLMCENKKIEIKAFTSNGPSSFGPGEKWDELIFVDAKNFEKKEFKIYMIKLSNDSEEWKNIKINSKETFSKQCTDGKRPRICFDKIKQTLGNNVNVIFDGTLSLEKECIVFSTNKNNTAKKIAKVKKSSAEKKKVIDSSESKGKAPIEKN